MKRIPVYVPEEHHEQIRVLAFKNKVSMAEEIRKAIELYLKNNGLTIEYHLDLSNIGDTLYIGRERIKEVDKNG